METYYLDASALAKRYIEERGTVFIRGLFFKKAADLITSQICELELCSALWRRTSEGALSQAQFHAALQQLDLDLKDRIIQMEASLEIVQRGRGFIVQHGLRPLDAVHLATAMIMQSSNILDPNSRLVFACSDIRLKNVAEGEGLEVLDPSTV